MPHQTKSSFSAKARLSKTKGVTLASVAKNGFKCDINGCKSSFKHQTDLSRHKWAHLPVHLRPTCPFEGAHGYRCSERYTGRLDIIRAHWMKDHPGPYPEGVKWPKLNEILSKNNLKLGENNPRIFTPRTSHLPSPAPSLESVSDAPSSAEVYHNVTWSPDQHGPQLAHRYTPQLALFYANPQGFSQPATPSFSPNFTFPAACPHHHQYMAAPVHPTFVNATSLTFSGQYVSNSFEGQSEDMSFDLSLTHSQDPVTEEEWNELVRQNEEWNELKKNEEWNYAHGGYDNSVAYAQEAYDTDAYGGTYPAYQGQHTQYDAHYDANGARYPSQQQPPRQMP